MLNTRNIVFLAKCLKVKMCVVAFVFVLVIGTISGELLKLRDGFVKGTTGRSKNNQMYRQFYGIPYAEPPVGKLRFQPPVPVKPWNGIKDATTPPPVCVQPRQFYVINCPIVGQEDCLYLNVHAPVIIRTGFASRLPVIVFIHGGGFLTGAGAEYNPAYFMDKNVIFVSLNYRLGSLGFLGMNNDHISGNAGLKDQALALKWVKENIEKFGGDPNNISLMGESAGAGAVHLHMFSPLSKGLFNKAIMQSGSALSTWAYYDETNTKGLASAFIFTVGCYYKEPEKVLKCLQKVPADALSQAETRLFVWDYDPTMLFKGTIESKVTNQPFLPHKPSKETYVTKNIPLIIGMNSGEGAFKAVRYLGSGGALARLLENDKRRLLPVINQYLYTTEPDQVEEVTAKIIEYYFGKNPIGPDTDLKLVQMITDSLFTYSLVKTVMSSSGPRYVYFYDHRAILLSQSRLGSYRKDLGVSHGDEMPFLFRYEQVEAKWTPADEKVSQTLLNFWLNFAAYTDPNGHFSEKVWKPVQSSAIEYLHIKTDGVVMEKDFLKERYNFWDSLPLGKRYD